MSSRRPRRTRIYDSNYRIGESAYRSALDGIDRKYNIGGFRESSLPKPRLDFTSDAAFDASMNDARNRASRAITEETCFDSKGFKVPKVGVPLTDNLTSDFDAEVQASLEKFRRERKKYLEDDLEVETKPVVASFARRAEAEINDSLYNSSSETSNFIKRRALKVVASTENAIDSKDLTKWTRLDKAIQNDSNDALAMSKSRSLATKVRLAELEDDMNQREERQLARERRVANLKKYVREELDTGLEEGVKAITF